jgi:hypothetical protein
MAPQRVPEALRQHQPELDEALATPLLMTWDDEESFADAAQPAAIAAVLVDAIHTHLVNAQIGYLFRKDIKRRGQVVLGQASKVGGKLAHFSHLDFLIEINWERWILLDSTRRIALMDHELEHCGVDDTEKGEKFVLVPHDVEEFNSIARRWGIWRPQLAQFADALGTGQQLGLFPLD